MTPTPEFKSVDCTNEADVIQQRISQAIKLILAGKTLVETAYRVEFTD